MPPEELYKFDRSEALMARARKVIPSGIYGHQSPVLLVPGEYPSFMARGEGCRIWDVDGNEYIDFMCSYGPIVLGHNHPRVEEAAHAQHRRADCQNLPGEVWVELAELLVEITPAADWAVFAKNGSDVTSWSLAVARAHTHRDKIIMVAGAYHGTHPWCSPLPAGLTEADRAHVLTFRYNDLDDLRRVVTENRDDIAALILCPFKHDAFHDQEMPAPGFHQGVREICDQEGIVLILDDIRAGFRLHLGGSGEVLGLRPDLICYCKAIANGYPLAAGLGREELRQAAQSVFFTGSYWTAAVPMAAAIATINTLREEGGIERMEAMGARFRQGLDQQARSLGLAITQTGPPAIPFMTFDADQGTFQRSRVFCGECARRGVFLHPHHNWFLSAAHTEADIDEALAVTEVAFKIVKERFGG
ncbi:MAG: aspartate aminotransferase family protein [Dehalococcoidia bacterium]